MELKEKAIKELNDLDYPQIQIVYDMIQELKKSGYDTPLSDRSNWIKRVRENLSSINGSLGDDIREGRADRL